MATKTSVPCPRCNAVNLFAEPMLFPLTEQCVGCRVLLRYTGNGNVTADPPPVLSELTPEVAAEQPKPARCDPMGKPRMAVAHELGHTLPPAFGTPRMGPVVDSLRQIREVIRKADEVALAHLRSVAAGLRLSPTTLRSQDQCHQAPARTHEADQSVRIGPKDEGFWSYITAEPLPEPPPVYVDQFDPAAYPVGTSARMIVRAGKFVWEVKIPPKDEATLRNRLVKINATDPGWQDRPLHLEHRKPTSTVEIPCPVCGVKNTFGTPVAWVLTQQCTNCRTGIRYDGCKVTQVGNATTLPRSEWRELPETITMDVQLTPEGEAEVRRQFDEYASGLRRYLALDGVNGNPLKEPPVEFDLRTIELPIQRHPDQPTFVRPLPVNHEPFSYGERQQAADRELLRRMEDNTLEGIVKTAEETGRRVAEQVERLVLDQTTSYTYGGGTILPAPADVLRMMDELRPADEPTIIERKTDDA